MPRIVARACPALLAGTLVLVAGCAPAARPVATRHAATNGVGIAPDPAFATSVLTAVVEGAEAGACAYAWRRDGRAIAGATGATLAPPAFARGDSIEVMVTLPGGLVRLAGTRIANSPPRVTNATLALVTEAGGALVRATVEGVDPDGDTPTFEYQWFRNGAPIAGATGPSLPATAFSRGDRVTASVVASDGIDRSPPQRTESLSLENHPPQFTSQPPAPRLKDDVYRYHAVASDPDGDALRYELVQSPAGMSMDGEGNLSWTLPQRGMRRGEQVVVIRARDTAGGSATQEFSIPLRDSTSSR
jgi:hypothetical protein